MISSSSTTRMRLSVSVAAELAPDSTGEGLPRTCLLSLLCTIGQPEKERSAAPLPGALRPDAPAVPLHDAAADVQAQPHAGQAQPGGVRGAAERLEDRFRGARRQPDPLVSHLDAEPVSLRLGSDAHQAALRGILDRVID